MQKNLFWFPRGCSYLKIQPRKEFLIFQYINKKPLSYRSYRSNPNFEQSSEKKDADTRTDRRFTRTRSFGDGTSDPDDVKSESFVSDDSEIEPVVKKRKDSAFDSIMLELKLMDENKTISKA